MSEEKTFYRLAPCSAYDVEGTESWLEDMAARGFVLSRDGFFLGAGIFEKSEPKKLRYRLEAAERKSTLLSDYDELPDEDALELSEKEGWQYVAMRGQFFIYRTQDENAVELNTDPQVQAMSLNKVRKAVIWNLIYWILWIFVLIPIVWRISPVLLMLELGLAKSLLTFAVVAFTLGFSARRVVLLCRLRKRLKSGQAVKRVKFRSKSALRYWLFHILGAGLTAAWAIVILAGFLNSASNENQIRLGEYTGELPFATMADFAPGGEYKREEMYFHGSNTVELRSNLFAPFAAEYHEIADITLSDGRKISGILNIGYYETASPFLARGAAKALYRKDRRDKYFSPIEVDIDGVEYFAAYYDMFPTVVIQDGCRVIRASFSQTGEEDALPLEYWAGILAESIRVK